MKRIIALIGIGICVGIIVFYSTRPVLVKQSPKEVLALIHEAESRFKAGSYNDANDDCVGENGTIAQLCGLEQCWAGIILKPFLNGKASRWAPTNDDHAITTANLSAVEYDDYLAISLTRVVYAKSAWGFVSEFEKHGSAQEKSPGYAKDLWFKTVYPEMIKDIAYDRNHYLVMIVRKSDLTKETVNGWVSRAGRRSPRWR